VPSRYRLTSKGLDYGSCRYARCPWQIYDFTYIGEMVELSYPVVTHDKYIGAILLEVFTLLLKAVLDEHVVDVAYRAYDLHALTEREHCTFVLFTAVKFVAGHANHESVAERRCTPQYIEVADVKQVVRPKRDDSPHSI
jgi:hypothetical protein